MTIVDRVMENYESVPHGQLIVKNSNLLLLFIFFSFTRTTKSKIYVGMYPFIE